MSDKPNIPYRPSEHKRIDIFWEANQLWKPLHPATPLQLKNKRIIVVGAGFDGLEAAWYSTWSQSAAFWKRMHIWADG